MQPETLNLLIGFLGAALGGALTSFANWLNYRQAEKKDKRRIAFAREKLEIERSSVERKDAREKEAADDLLVRKAISETILANAEVRRKQVMLEKGEAVHVPHTVVDELRSALIDWLMLTPCSPEVNQLVGEHLAMENEPFAAASHTLARRLAKSVTEMAQNQ